MMGRTHSVHAEPTTLGLKLAGWAFELERGRVRLAAAVDEIGTGKISGPVGTYSHLGPDIEAEVLAALGLHADPVSTQIVQRDRHAGAAGRDRDHRRLAGALRDRGPQPPAHRDRRAPGAVQGRPEGLVGDAPQAQPDPVRADRRSRPAAARLRPHRARGPAPLARARHQPLQRRAGHPARRDDPARLHAGADDRARRRPARPLRADAREHRARARPACLVRVLVALVDDGRPVARGGLRDRPARLAPGGRRARRRCATCWRSTRPSPSACRSPSSTRASTTPRSCATSRRSSRGSTGSGALGRTRHPGGARCCADAFLRSGKVRDLYVLRRRPPAARRVGPDQRLRRRPADR